MKRFYMVIIALIMLCSCEAAEEPLPEEPQSEPENSGNPSSEEPVPEKTESFEDYVSGDFVVLKTEGKSLYEALEFEDKIIVYYVEGEIEAFDTLTGEKLYGYFLGDVNKTKAFNFTKTDEKEGFDFKVLMEDKIVYLSSKDPEAKEEIFLPENVMETKTGSYSMYGNKIIWSSGDGIRIFDFGTGSEELLLKNSIIDEKIKPIAKPVTDKTYIIDNGEECSFEKPRFICSGRKVAVTAVSRYGLYWATAVYDLENENFDWAYSFNEMLVDDYPIKDRFVKIGDVYIDAENGSRKTDLDNEPENAGRSYDFEIKDDEIEAYIMGVTENYLIIMLCKDEARCYCLIEYK